MTDAPAHISYSQINSYGQCPLKYKLDRLDGLGKDDPAAWTYGGTVVHDAIDYWNKSVMDGDPADPVACTAVAWEQVEIPDGPMRASRNEDLEWWKKNAVTMVENWTRWVTESPYQIIGSEVEVTGEVNGVEIVGAIDCVLEHELSDMRMIVDYKTGRTTPTTNFQLGIYKVLLGETMGDISYGAFFKPRTYRPRGKPVQYGSLVGPFSLDGWTTEVVEQWTQGLLLAKQHGVFPPNPSALCNYCDVREHCYAYLADKQGNDHG